ncbi:ribonuclease P protein component [Pseudonocardia ailaonensis]|uniref:Ribonuclease P protein component n=1 Tax=Pseudonocardia ailaonensis TaxID=367279 RepID=A0ABN2NM86_9PSEU
MPAGARLTRRADFATTIRRGRRAGRNRLVVHLHIADPMADQTITDPAPPSARAGFVVSKAVGNAVVRHRVARRLRHVVADRIEALPPGALVVVRALPPAAEASSADLGGDFDSALRSALKKSRAAEPAR